MMASRPPPFLGYYANADERVDHVRELTRELGRAPAAADLAASLAVGLIITAEITDAPCAACGSTRTVGTSWTTDGDQVVAAYALCAPCDVRSSNDEGWLATLHRDVLARERDELGQQGTWGAS